MFSFILKIAKPFPKRIVPLYILPVCMRGPISVLLSTFDVNLFHFSSSGGCCGGILLWF